MEAREKSEIVFKQKNVRNNKREREKKNNNEDRMNDREGRRR